MTTDVLELSSFYATPLGQMARRVILRAAMRMWGETGAGRLMGLGYATPYLPGLGARAERSLAFMPAQQGVVHWPAQGPSAATLVDPFMLPLDDATIDRIVVVHALEGTESPDEMLGECWRVLAPGGRLMVIAPNRRGMWARVDGTPFGHGRPYSRRQLDHLLRGARFAPESWCEALYAPPLGRPSVLKSAALWEKLGSSIGLPFSGVHIIDASKQFYRRAPAKSRRAFALQQMLQPMPAPAAGREAAEPARRGA
jgi:SAM-dependent methyltransferase